MSDLSNYPMSKVQLIQAARKEQIPNSKKILCKTTFELEFGACFLEFSQVCDLFAI